MSVITSHHPFVIQLAQELGLDTKRLTGFTLECRNGEAVKVTATFLAERDPAAEKPPFFEQRFQMVERPS